MRGGGGAVLLATPILVSWVPPAAKLACIVLLYSQLMKSLALCTFRAVSGYENASCLSPLRILISGRFAA